MCCRVLRHGSAPVEHQVPEDEEDYADGDGAVGDVEGRPVGRTEVEIETIGEREQEAMDALLALIADKFGEGE